MNKEPYPKRRIVIRASTLYQAIPCDQYSRFYYVDQIEKAIDFSSIAMEYGTGFHGFSANLLEAREDYSRDSIKRALIKPLSRFVDYITNMDPLLMANADEWKTPSHLKKTCLKWARHCAKGDDNFVPLTNSEGTLACEKTLFIPYYSDDYIEVILRITIDRLGFFRDVDGKYKPIFQDFKSTANTRKDAYMSGYELNTQMSFYHFCLWWMMDKDLLPPEFEYIKLQIIGIFIRRETEKNPEVCEIRYGDRLSIRKDKRELFKLGLDMLIQRISKIVQDGKRFYLPNNCFANCKQSYGLCTYFEVCNKMRNAEDMLRKYRKFDPFKQHDEE